MERWGESPAPNVAPSPVFDEADPMVSEPLRFLVTLDEAQTTILTERPCVFVNM